MRFAPFIIHRLRAAANSLATHFDARGVPQWAAHTLSPRPCRQRDSRYNQRMDAASPLLIFDFDGRRRSFADPARVIVATRLEDVRPALREAERAARAGLYAAGFVAYEAAPAFDAALAVRPP